MTGQKTVETEHPARETGTSPRQENDNAMDREVLMLQLRQAYGGTPGERRAVARSADDLHDSGKYQTDTGTELDASRIIEELADAPGGTPAERWNWWMGALDLAYGGYDKFGVRRWAEE